MTQAEDFEAWVGRERVVEDTLTLGQSRRLAATLDLDPDRFAEGDVLPHGWHWVYCRPPIRRTALAPDGHERRGDFLPPIALDQRMWAGGRVRFLAPLRIGATVRRVSTIRSIERKQGRSGPLVFVTVVHRLFDAAGVAVEEEQDLVYLRRTPPPREEEARGPASATAGDTPTPSWQESFEADEVTLFRFSALTFNGHRIHYDRRYSVDREGYPDVVVHGPLLALLLVGAGARWSAATSPWAGAEEEARFTYRALRPVFCNERVAVCGAPAADGADGVDLWVAHPERGMAMRARFATGQAS